ncbi:hypothetical protein NDI52_29735 [Leptolyngbya sp. PL-A3]|uniref:hypothetical protein n=1 Tax=Leptolyngbya sp. PL-A3 TaxID=2933911 RepID=UPI00329A3FF5
MKAINSKGFLSFAHPIVSNFLLKQQKPWISLSLLCLSYAAQGYLLASKHQSLIIYINLVTIYFLSQVIILHPCSKSIGTTIKRWISSDAIHVISSLVTIFIVSFILNYLEIFENLLFVLAAELLARLDLQKVELSQVQKIAVLTICLMLGLAIGWIASERLLNLHKSQDVVRNFPQLYKIPHALQQQGIFAPLQPYYAFNQVVDEAQFTSPDMSICL